MSGLATYGRAEEIQVFLDSLRSQCFRSFELVVVDQNPDERICPFLERACAGSIEAVRLLQDSPNLSLARNAGLHVARAEFVGFPDDDCWYEPETLFRVHEFLTSAPTVDGVVARWVDVTPDPDSGSPRRLSLETWRRFRGGDASSITLFLRRSLVKTLGGFDSRLGVGQWYGAGEETDLLLRLLAAGADIRVLSTARVRHAPPLSTGRLSSDQWQAKRRRERGVGALYVKHRLSPFVIARGLLAPLMMNFIPRASSSATNGFALGLASTLGRFEGMLHWIVREGRDRI
ncbi:MAG: glycosyltransferase family 2 protein [Lautropia sp.]|nr:MAG: glycosyltransferase family 2 protein [Pseudomonadota bacterium]MBC6960762.1 glycosyltransferase family 2 protein [Lautropia sp.]MCL4700641.1 glycosyltransferase [Burkholderiaceae bacterium]MDL1908620.1 glycosyltransferase [Betaproteobacteria bacterium PRO1]RIK87981.1 MAG: hypothetical protein DCC70_11370 [Burkholderiales bacterium]